MIIYIYNYRYSNIHGYIKDYKGEIIHLMALKQHLFGPLDSSAEDTRS